MNKFGTFTRQWERAGLVLRLLMSVIIMLSMILVTLSAAKPAAADAKLECTEQNLTVTLTPGATDTYNVVGTLCSMGPAEGKTVQLLLHGATYARYYWDFPYQADHYSYVRSATKRGYATFNLDRIGNGASDHPAGELVDMNANGFVIHQVVEALRAGHVASQLFTKVIVVGHSMGSFSALNYAGNFPGEADGIILTGFLNDMNWPFATSLLGTSIYPATLDPKFYGLYPNNDYFTTKPGTRDDAFYYIPNADPVVIAVDENLKQTTSLGEVNTGLQIVYDPISFQVKGPVQVVVGQYDTLFCGNLVNCSDKASVQKYEESFYSSSACVEADVIGDSGHDLNLQMNADAAYSQMLSWADRYVGSTAAQAPQTCAP